MRAKPRRRSRNPKLTATAPDGSPLVKFNREIRKHLGIKANPGRPFPERPCPNCSVIPDYTTGMACDPKAGHRHGLVRVHDWLKMDVEKATPRVIDIPRFSARGDSSPMSRSDFPAAVLHEAPDWYKLDYLTHGARTLGSMRYQIALGLIGTTFRERRNCRDITGAVPILSPDNHLIRKQDGRAYRMEFLFDDGSIACGSAIVECWWTRSGESQYAAAIDAYRFYVAVRQLLSSDDPSERKKAEQSFFVGEPACPGDQNWHDDRFIWSSDIGRPSVLIGPPDSAPTNYDLRPLPERDGFRIIPAVPNLYFRGVQLYGDETIGSRRIVAAYISGEDLLLKRKLSTAAHAGLAYLLRSFRADALVLDVDDPNVLSEYFFEFLKTRGERVVRIASGGAKTGDLGDEVHSHHLIILTRSPADYEHLGTIARAIGLTVCRSIRPPFAAHRDKAKTGAIRSFEHANPHVPHLLAAFLGQDSLWDIQRDETGKFNSPEPEVPALPSIHEAKVSDAAAAFLREFGERRDAECKTAYAAYQADLEQRRSSHALHNRGERSDGAAWADTEYSSWPSDPEEAELLRRVWGNPAGWDEAPSPIASAPLWATLPLAGGSAGESSSADALAHTDVGVSCLGTRDGGPGSVGGADSGDDDGGGGDPSRGSGRREQRRLSEKVRACLARLSGQGCRDPDGLEAYLKRKLDLMLRDESLSCPGSDVPYDSDVQKTQAIIVILIVLRMARSADDVLLNYMHYPAMRRYEKWHLRRRRQKLAGDFRRACAYLQGTRQTKNSTNRHRQVDHEVGRDTARLLCKTATAFILAAKDAARFGLAVITSKGSDLARSTSDRLVAKKIGFSSCAALKREKDRALGSGLLSTCVEGKSGHPNATAYAINERLVDDALAELLRSDGAQAALSYDGFDSRVGASEDVNLRALDEVVRRFSWRTYGLLVTAVESQAFRSGYLPVRALMLVCGRILGFSFEYLQERLPQSPYTTERGRLDLLRIGIDVADPQLERAALVGKLVTYALESGAVEDLRGQENFQALQREEFYSWGVRVCASETLARAFALIVRSGTVQVSEHLRLEAERVLTEPWVWRPHPRGPPRDGRDDDEEDWYASTYEIYGDHSEGDDEDSYEEGYGCEHSEQAVQAL